MSTVTVKMHTLVPFAAGLAIAIVGLFAFQSLRVGAVAADEATAVQITPCRLFDTRPGSTVGTKSSPLGPGESHAFQVTGSNGDCTIPAAATAVSINLTGVNPTAQTNLRMYPANEAVPTAAVLNMSAGQAPLPNKLDVKLSPDGKLAVFNKFGQIHVIGDVMGYYRHDGLADLENQLADAHDQIGALENDMTDAETEIDALQARGPLWAVIDNGPTCTLSRGSGAVSVETVGVSRCDVKFDRDVSDCVAAATIAQTSSADITTMTYSDHPNPDPSGLTTDEVYVATTRGHDPVAERHDFSVIVFC